MPTMVACVGPTILSVTGLTETAIGTSWTVPAGTRAILGVRVHVACGTVHDASLSAIPRLRIASDDIKPNVAPCEILCEPPGSSPVTSGNSASQVPNGYYPLNLPVSGGEVMYFYGTDYVTMTTAPWMGVDVYYSDEGPSGPQYHYKASAAVYATTVTAGAAHKDPTTYRISGGVAITQAYGVVWQTTSTAAVGCIGKFELSSSDFKVPMALSWNNEGGGGILSAGDLVVRVSKAGCRDAPLNLPIGDQCNITQNWINGPTNIVGAYVTGVQYI